MATNVLKIDSNVTGLRIAEEETIGVLPVTPVWNPYEPNSYSDFGGEFESVARAPINPNRQREKGTQVDKDATGGFNTDLTKTNLRSLLQGFFFADLRLKDTFGDGSGVITAVDGTNEEYEGTSIETGLLVGDLIKAQGFLDSANNGLKRITSVTGPNAIVVAENLVTEASPPAAAKITHVGFQFATGDAEIDATGTLPTLITTVKDLTEFGLLPGEYVWIGGDSAATQFANAANKGMCRVKSVTTNAITFDKAPNALVTDDGATKTIQIFFGHVLKNEVGTDIVRRTYQLERTLGAPDTTQPLEVQSEYVEGAVPGSAVFNIQTADKINADLTFVATNETTRTGVVGVKSGTRPDLVSEGALNTSSDFYRIKLAVVSSSDEAPTPLFAFAQELTITIDNGPTPNKAIGVTGAFDVSVGDFVVTADLNVYFADVESKDAIRNNSDITLDMHVVSDNGGISFDMPVCTLGDGKINVEKDAAVTIPLTLDATNGAKYDPNMDHTLLMVFWEYLPDLAE